MPRAITITIGKIELKGEFNDSPAGRAMAAALPIDCRWSRWGDEYYGTTTPLFGTYPGPETDLMEVGDLAYHGANGWFCLFFGPTPASRGTEPRAAVPVQKVGRVAGDWGALKSLGDSIVARIEPA
ncbi:MAG: cyclophilin-like fold protein [Desulfobacterales bacterium]|jgi:hypothetical protein|nr:cyclophilin-like fold protein [Desulfobacterales bacterium]